MKKWLFTTLAGALVVAAVALGSFRSGVVRVDAQSAGLPFVIGDTISLQYDGAPSRQCRVEAIAGDFVKCQHPRDQAWYNIRATLLILRCSPLPTPGCQ
jgi:hypothetical protein